MGRKNGRRVRKTEVPNDSVPEFELRDTVADIQQRREDREAKEKEEAQQQQQREEEAREGQEWRNSISKIKRTDIQKKAQDRKK